MGGTLTAGSTASITLSVEAVSGSYTAWTKTVSVTGKQGTEFTDTQGNTITIEPVVSYGGAIERYTITGSVYIGDINTEKFKTELKNFDGKEFDTSKLKIDCFTRTTTSSTGRNVVTTEPIPVNVIPELLKQVLEIGQKFSNFKLNNKLDDKIVEIELSSATNNYFDITKFAKFNFNSEFKLKNGSEIYLNGIKKHKVLKVGI